MLSNSHNLCHPKQVLIDWTFILCVIHSNREETLFFPYIGDVYILCWGVWFRKEPLIMALYWRCTDFGLVTSYWFREGINDESRNSIWWRVLGSERNLRTVFELEVEMSIYLYCLSHSCIMNIRDRCTNFGPETSCWFRRGDQWRVWWWQTLIQWRVSGSEVGTNDESGTLVQLRVLVSKVRTCDEFWFREEQNLETNHWWMDKSVT